MPEVKHEKGGQCAVGAQWSALGSTHPGAALLLWASTAPWESRVGWPCSVGIWSERVEALGGRPVAGWGELDPPGSCESTDGGVNPGDRQL